ncbi:MAG: hypothetical protein ACK4ZA_03495, partial [Tsuneonella troitsensis]
MPRVFSRISEWPRPYLRERSKANIKLPLYVSPDPASQLLPLDRMVAECQVRRLEGALNRQCSPALPLHPQSHALSRPADVPLIIKGTFEMAIKVGDKLPDVKLV